MEQNEFVGRSEHDRRKYQVRRILAGSCSIKTLII